MNKHGQIGFIMGLAGFLILIMAIITFALLSPILGSFIEMGRNSSEARGDSATSFIISLAPLWIVLLLVGIGIYLISSGGGGGL